MGLITETALTHWSASNKKTYEDCGYIFTKMNDILEVKVSELSKNSKYIIQYMCDGCGEIHNREWDEYLSSVKNNKTFCRKCKNLARLNSGKSQSLYDWCNENNRNDIMDLWDYEKNKISPKEVTSSSRKKYWFKNKYSESKLLLINGITTGSIINIDKSHKTIGAWLLKKYGKDALKNYWAKNNKMNPFEISSNSNEKIWIICQNCKTVKQIDAVQFTRSGLGCNKCSDGVSVPNKIAFNLLEQIGVDFKAEYSPSWIKPKRYDFYFKMNNKKYILEMDGAWHYIDNNLSGLTKEEALKNDIYKEDLAKKHGIEVIRINCSISNISYIKNNIIKSKLGILFNLSDIDWDICCKYAYESLIKKTIDLWNESQTVVNISENLKIHEKTVIKYILIGKELGMCTRLYKTKEKTKKVICVNYLKVFNSVKEAEEDFNIHDVSACCRNKAKSSGKTKEGNPLIWQFYDDYLKNPKSLKYINNRHKRVICITSGKVFINIQEAANYYNAYATNIIKSCKNNNVMAGKLEDGTPLKWMYCEDYLKLHNETNIEQVV